MKIVKSAVYEYEKNNINLQSKKQDKLPNTQLQLQLCREYQTRLFFV